MGSGRGEFRVGFDWGLTGAQASGAGITTIVDVLSFSTAVSVACDLGIEVFPFRWQDDRATDFARDQGAELARGRRRGGLSLSPASIRQVTGISRLVLPSPNGASICAALAGTGAVVLAGCLRNASAIASWLGTRLAAEAEEHQRVVVIAAGERWPDGSLRPAVEDLWGAGAIIAGLARQLPSEQFSPEARAAAAAFDALGPELGEQLTASVSGQELIGYGFGSDVGIAAELDASNRVPLLLDGAFHPA